MFNEAFWFFYWISVVGALKELFIAFTIIGIVGYVLFSVGCALESQAKAWKAATYRVIPAIIICGLLWVFTPPEEAFYAGAAQYVGEGVELDDTLMQLKELVDERIAELSDE